MHVRLMAATLVIILAMPTLVSAEDAATGGATGAAVGANGGTVTGGTAVDTGAGGTVGAAPSDDDRPREIVVEPAEPAAKEKTCVTHADGTRVCEEIRR